MPDFGIRGKTLCEGCGIVSCVKGWRFVTIGKRGRLAGNILSAGVRVANWGLASVPWLCLDPAMIFASDNWAGASQPVMDALAANNTDFAAAYGRERNAR